MRLYTVILTNKTTENLEELIDIDICPPPDLKSEYFLDLIEENYKKIRENAKHTLSTAKSEEQISLFVNKSILRLKDIAGQAHILSRRLKPEKGDESDHPDSYIIGVLKTFLIRSILFYQEYFESYLKTPVTDYFQLRTSLYGEMSYADFVNGWNESSKTSFYKKLSAEMLMIEKGDIEDSKCQTFRLKNLSLNENWINKIAKESVANGFIGNCHLAIIMAWEKGYVENSILAQLIENTYSESFRCSLFFIPNQLSINDFKNRIYIWKQLMFPWIEGNYPWLKKNALDTKHLPLYNFDPVKKELEKIDLRKKYAQILQRLRDSKSKKYTLKKAIERNKIFNVIPCYIKLPELKKYCIEIIGISPPSLLFGKNKNDFKNIEEKTKSALRPNQEAREKCRKIAKAIWDKTPDMTIADMIEDPKIIEITKKKDGHLYVEKTVRNWIKDLCPNRLAGRRPKKQ